MMFDCSSTYAQFEPTSSCPRAFNLCWSARSLYGHVLTWLILAGRKDNPCATEKPPCAGTKVKQVKSF